LIFLLLSQQSKGQPAAAAAILAQNAIPEAKSAIFQPVVPENPLAIPAAVCYKAGKNGTARCPGRAPTNIKKILEIMSQHRSLRAASTTGAKRNVLKRFERVEVLKKRGQWKPGDRVAGLRKTKPDA
jgi:small basic protein (TIGR04137 family)